MNAALLLCLSLFVSADAPRKLSKAERLETGATIAYSSTAPGGRLYFPPAQPRPLFTPGQPVSPPAPLSAKEYALQKQRFAEWQVYKRAKSKATARGRSSRTVSTHDSYINAAQQAVRSVQGR